MTLKDRKRSVDCTVFWVFDIQIVADVVRRGRLRWFGHLEHRSVDDWVLPYRKVEVAGMRCEGRKRETWKKCVDDDMNESAWFAAEWAIFRDTWREFIF